MDYQDIRYELAAGVARLVLARPERLNALTSRMRAEMLAAVRRAGQEARVLVITGEGRGFCAGQDLADRAGRERPDLGQSLRDEYAPMIRAIADCPVPVIAAVNGPAAGAGANLALACDVVIAAESAVFLQAFSRIGLVPDAGGSWFLPRQVGMARAMGAALFAEPVSARQAADWGMIWEAVADADFAAHVAARAAALAAGPTLAYRHAKRAIRASWGNDLAAQLELEAEAQSECGRSQDFAEGVQAFLDKRPARFGGR